jgi:hypothetical protein
MYINAKDDKSLALSAVTFACKMQHLIHTKKSMLPCVVFSVKSINDPKLPVNAFYTSHIWDMREVLEEN